MAKLFIVESPGKLKTLRKILGPGWLLEASVGHTTELASDGPRKLGFEFTAGDRILTRYVPRGSRGKQVLQKLRQAARKADIVFLATDPDREGEAIAWHLIEQLNLKNWKRVTYTQITEAAVKKAIAHPDSLNTSLVHSQRARQCLDKLVGFEVSPLLWNSTGGKSAGRVQSSTLHLICERERERLAFVPENYWVLKSKYGEGFEATFEPQLQAGKSGPESKDPARETDDESSRVRSEDEAKLIAEVARTSPHVVRANETKVESRNPPPPLITSSLQQSAGGRYRYSPKKTMQIAQELYEGIQGKGLITYMRTDAVALSPEFVREARNWLTEHAPEVLPEKPPFYRTRSDSQGVHEAIRPTSVDLTPEQASRFLNKDQLNIYRLIWERAVASQCKPAKLSKTRILIEAASTLWVARGTTVLDPGYLQFWKNMEEDAVLPEVKVGQQLKFLDVTMDAKTTSPPPRYSEPKLVQLMEKKGIGRPSTYASTISTLKDRDYVVLEKGSLAPTSLGMATDEALTLALPDLVDTAFTATMERSLDEIAEGKLNWEKYLTQWSFEYLSPALAKARQALKSVSRVASRGRTASAATDAPRAKRPHTPSAEDQKKIEKALTSAQKNGPLPICPKGHGDLSLRLSQKGTLYWKCAQSSCDSISWYQEFSSEKCPNCSNPMEKIASKKVTGGYFLKCGRREAHQDATPEVVLFRNRETREWEAPGTRSKRSSSGPDGAAPAKRRSRRPSGRRGSRAPYR